MASLGVHTSSLFTDVKASSHKQHFQTRVAVRAAQSGWDVPMPSRNTPQGEDSGVAKSFVPQPISAKPSPGPAFQEYSGLNMSGSPGSPRPKPGTPRPYDPSKQKSKVMEWLTPPEPPKELLQSVLYKLSDTCSMTIYFGDMSKWYVDGRTDAVIAPANKRLNMGPAVNAVLFKAAGSRLLDTTQRLPDVAPQGIKAEVGNAISTRAFNLPVARVIHTVGPVYKKDEQTNERISDPLLEKAYKAALAIARNEELKYLAFPPLSCRIYGYPYSEGAEIALKTLKDNCQGFLQIDIVIRNIEGYEAFIDEANKVLQIVKEKKTVLAPTMRTPLPVAATNYSQSQTSSTSTNYSQSQTSSTSPVSPTHAEAPPYQRSSQPPPLYTRSSVPPPSYSPHE